MKLVDSIFSIKKHINNKMNILILKILSGSSNDREDIKELERLREFGKYPKTVIFK